MDNENIETEEMENNNEITEEKVMSPEEYIEKLNNDLEEQKQKKGIWQNLIITKKELLKKKKVCIM